MNVAIISALSALAGSIVGGLTLGVMTWMNLRAQARAQRREHLAQAKAQRREHHLSRQEDLYRDFIMAASKAYGEANQSHEPQVQELVALYAMIGRMRIRSSARIVACAEKVIDVTINTYFSPNKTIAEIHALLKSGEGLDPLKEFAEAARDELQEAARDELEDFS
jgi:hypothetical protein